MKSMLTLIALGASLTLTVPAVAGTGHSHDDEPAPTAIQAGFINGEVKRLYKEQGKIALKPEMGMQGMSMVYRVKDASLLDQVKVGDNVRYMLEKVGRDLAVTKLEIMK